MKHVITIFGVVISLVMLSGCLPEDTVTDETTEVAETDDQQVDYQPDNEPPYPEPATNQVTFTYQWGNTTDITSDITSYEFRGTTSILNFAYIDDSNEIVVSDIRFKYYLSSFFGEPTQQGIFYWNGRSGADEIYTVTIRSKIFAENGVFTGYYHTYSPLVSNEGEWSWDTTGSPNWDEFLWTDEAMTTYATRDEAISLYKSGFYMGESDIIKINGIDVSK